MECTVRLTLEEIEIIKNALKRYRYECLDQAGMAKVLKMLLDKAVTKPSTEAK